jgi:hypothetical protein
MAVGRRHGSWRSNREQQKSETNKGEPHGILLQAAKRTSQLSPDGSMSTMTQTGKTVPLQSPMNAGPFWIMLLLSSAPTSVEWSKGSEFQYRFRQILLQKSMIGWARHGLLASVPKPERTASAHRWSNHEGHAAKAGRRNHAFAGNPKITISSNLMMTSNPFAWAWPHPLESGLCQNRGALLEVVVIALGQDDDCFWIRAARYPMWIGDHAVPPEIIGGSEIGAGKVESESSNAC